MVWSFHNATPYRCYDHDHGPDVLPCDDVAVAGVFGMVGYTVEVAAVHCMVEVAAGLVVVPVDMPVESGSAPGSSY